MICASFPCRNKSSFVTQFSEIQRAPGWHDKGTLWYYRLTHAKVPILSMRRGKQNVTPSEEKRKKEAEERSRWKERTNEKEIYAAYGADVDAPLDWGKRLRWVFGV
ncbi:hypothetical protein ONS95_013069 [Cadophora gregata]|uniref:uncharacterized protein n=1 Tax=Cadophora gregata TaxID=51156 RepID=UPI0026DD7314|nr:uncharacterized protein ONS95_013069 [Cadophora gregata]KAK0116033.1 hypothetical protein ONS95_013069 [Cadophora gregata]